MGSFCSTVVDADLPKFVELNVTLDGSIEPGVLWDLNTNEGGEEEFEVGKFRLQRPATASREWLDCVRKVKTILNGSDVDAFETLAYQFCCSQRNQLIYYSEVRFEPFSFLEEDQFNLITDLVNAVSRGLRRGEEKFQVVVRCILSCNRSQPQTCKKLIQLIRKFDNVVGLNICGDELLYGIEELIPIVEKAKNSEEGLFLTVEACGPENVRTAIEILKCDRLSYVCDCVGDEEIFELIRNSGVHIEASYKASIFLKSATTEEHPLMGFKNERILFSINTMEPLFLCCSLRSELDKCQKFLQFTDKDLHNCWHRAAQASFLKETEKKKLIKIIEKRAGPYIPGD